MFETSFITSLSCKISSVVERFHKPEENSGYRKSRHAMSSIILLVGQCGNQVGHELMSLIDKSDTHPLSHRDGKLRCVCVDSEAKVINHNYREDMRSGRLYREGNMISGQRGRGNNWALGYHGLNGETDETSLLHRAMETVRKEVERCDNYAGKGLDYWTHCSCVKVKVFL